jgi:hypothetical protein
MMTAAEAKAVIDRFLAAGSSPPAIAAVAKFLIDKVSADELVAFERMVTDQHVMDDVSP